MQFIDYKGFNKRTFEIDNNLSNGYLGKQLVRNADLGEGILVKILENCPDLSPEWLLTGKGEMLKSEVLVVKTNEIELDYLKKINQLQEYKIKQLEKENSRFESNIEFVKKNN